MISTDISKQKASYPVTGRSRTRRSRRLSWDPRPRPRGNRARRRAAPRQEVQLLHVNLKAQHAELEEHVRCRTRELTRANARWQREIEARKQADQALRESEERLRLMIEGTRDYAIFLLDTRGRVTPWNGGAEHITGYDRGRGGVRLPQS
jgi:PAS domain-containing protein